MTISVLLADDSALMRAAIARLLQSDPDIQLWAQTTSFSETLETTQRMQPQILILDLHMADENAMAPAGFANSRAAY